MEPIKDGVKFDNVMEDIVKKYFKNKHAYCMFPGCNMHAISSHSISKKISLSQIAEDGKLFTIKSKRMYPDKEYGIGDKGIRDASAFMGFCKQHDEMFSSLDKEGIKTEKDVFLQAYRTLCYVLFNERLIDEIAPVFYEGLEGNIPEDRTIKEVVEHAKKNAHQAKERRIKKLIAYCVDILEVLNRYELDSEVFGEDEYLIINGTRNMDVQNPFYNSKQPDLVIIHRKINYQIPVAISTKISYILKPEGREDELFLICIPYKESTDCIIMFDKHESVFAENNYYRHYLANDLNMLDLIEKVMACSEEWWISPNVYKNLPEAKKKVFVDDLYYGTVNICVWQVKNA